MHCVTQCPSHHGSSTSVLKVFAGPIIRISPNELHIADPYFHTRLYNYDGRWDKYNFVYRPFGFGDSPFLAIEHGEHQRRRRLWDPFFSQQEIARLRPVLDLGIEKLSERIAEFAASGSVLKIGIAYSALTMDIITEYATGTSYGNLDIEDFNGDLVYCFAGFGPVWRVAKHVPWLLPCFMKLPNGIIGMLGSKASLYRKLQEDCLDRIKTLRAKCESNTIEEKPYKTIFRDFITTDTLPPSGRTERALRDQLEGLIGGGTEPTAHVLRLVTYHLCRNPTMLHKLRVELDGLPVSQSQHLSLQQLENLRYLTAVIQEGLRLSYGVASRMPRIAPDRILKYEDWNIPPGTPVSMTHALIFHDEAIFPDSHAFSPERFMEPGAMERIAPCFAPFQRGARSCLGRHLAYAEMYLTIAILFSRFDFQLHETSIEDVQLKSDGYMPIMKGSNGVRVLVKKKKNEDPQLSIVDKETAT
ncbi:MAG: hypothetical protein M1828_006570 [Chrysothrix sp. TS-e1954]|nr:MAG: hypothetical protein M1828_006570 [Chrysothrix sp. TS-e1954]